LGEGEREIAATTIGVRLPQPSPSDPKELVEDALASRSLIRRARKRQP
jgi:hypothetical protein